MSIPGSTLRTENEGTEILPKKGPLTNSLSFLRRTIRWATGPERPSRTQSLEQLKLAAAVVLLSPYVPLLFMGEEYAEKAPFRYFVDFSDRALNEAVRKGRQAEFARFKWPAEVPDPQDEATFQQSRIDLDGAKSQEQTVLLQFYEELILLRKSTPTLASVSREHFEVNAFDDEKILAVRRWSDDEYSLCLYGFSDTAKRVSLFLPAGGWVKIIDSSAETWGGHSSLSPDRIGSNGEVYAIPVNAFGAVVYSMSLTPKA